MQTLPSFLITQCVTDLVQIRSQPCQVPGARCRWPVAKPRWKLSREILSSLPIRQILQSKFPENNCVGIFLAQCWIIWGPAASWWVVSIKFGHGIACAGCEEVSGASIPWEVASWWPGPGEGRGPWRPLQSIKRPGQDNGPSLQIWLLLVTGCVRNLGLPTS